MLSLVSSHWANISMPSNSIEETYLCVNSYCTMIPLSDSIRTCNVTCITMVTVNGYRISPTIIITNLCTDS